MFPSHRGGPGAGRGLVLAALAVVLGAALLLGSGDRARTETSRLEVTQASVTPLLFSDEEPAEQAPGRAVLQGGDGPVDRWTPTEASVTATAVVADVAQPEEAAPAPAGGDIAASTPVITVAPTPPSPTQASSTPAPSTSTSTSTSTTTTTTTTAPLPPRVPAGPARARSAEADVVPLTNHDRMAQGLGALSRSACLDSVASGFAEQMARTGVLAHNPGAGPAVTGCRPGAAWGDNVGTSEPCDTSLLERKWMASPGHRRNILTAAFELVGVGAWTDEQGGCWVQVLFSS